MVPSCRERCNHRITTAPSVYALVIRRWLYFSATGNSTSRRTAMPILTIQRVLVVPLFLLAVAACGDSADPGVATAEQPATTTPATSATTPAATAGSFSECMAQYGLEVKDPKPGEGLGIDPKVSENPKFDEAMEACKGFLEGGTRTESSDPADLDKYKAYAKCMRENGLPDFPDPKPGSNEGMFGGGVDRNSPAFQKASQKCDQHLAGVAG
jgi:hypothetical protein